MEPKPLDSNYGPPEKKRLTIKVDLLKFLRTWKKFRTRKKEREGHEIQR